MSRGSDVDVDRFFHILDSLHSKRDCIDDRFGNIWWYLNVHGNVDSLLRYDLHAVN